MNKLILLAIFLFVSMLSYVVYAITQDPANRMSGDIFTEVVKADSAKTNDDSPVQSTGSLLRELASKRQSKQPTVLANESIHQVVRGDAAMQYRVDEHTDTFSKSLPILREKHAVQESSLRVKIAKSQSEQGLAVDILFENVGDQSVKVIKPLDGSFYGWYQPNYRFTLKNANNDVMRLMPRCGNSGLWADTEWPDSYVVEIAPKESYKVPAALPFEVPESAEYTLSFEYTYQFKDGENAVKGFSGSPLGESVDLSKPIEGVWQGKVESNSINVRLKTNGRGARRRTTASGT